MKRKRGQTKSIPNSQDPRFQPGQGAIPIYHGKYIGIGVWITDAREIEDLYTRGNYGKGIYSRSVPEFFNSNNEAKRARFARKEKRMEGFHSLSVQKLRSENEADFDAYIPTKGSIQENNSSAQNQIEYLQLGLEEAYYLMNELGVLTISDNSGTDLDIKQCWQEFSKSPSFVCRYIAYRHYRFRGWCVKSGLKFGCDFVLYSVGPSYGHAEFGVTIIEVKEGTETKSIPWCQFLNMNRVSEQVAKGQILNFISPGSWVPMEQGRK